MSNYHPKKLEELRGGILLFTVLCSLGHLSFVFLFFSLHLALV